MTPNSNTNTMKSISRSQLVWILVSNGASLQGAFLPFTAKPDLDGVDITGIETMDSDTLTFTPDGVPVITPADALLLSVTLVEGSNQRHKHLPWNLSNPSIQFGIWKEFNPFRLTWQRSGVFASGPLSANVLAIPLNVHYRYSAD